MIDYAADPDIKKALEAGFTLDDLASREAEGRALDAICGSDVALAERGSEEWRAAIERYNELSVIVTTGPSGIQSAVLGESR